MSHWFTNSQAVMQRAIELARQGEGYVEPNPMVGAVIVDEGLSLIAEGYHQSFGGPHAEIDALSIAGERANDATMFVTLEPCCHQGKTGPCVAAIIDAGICRVVVGVQDPAPHVDGAGIAALNAAGIETEIGFLGDETSRLVAPFTKLVTTGRPYVHAKWAMSLDGKTATHSGSSRWISNELSRSRVHQLRGRMDAILIGSGTATADNPMLTARPPGSRTAARIIVDSRALLPSDSQLVRTLETAPVIVAASDDANESDVSRLKTAGVEVLQLPPSQNSESGSPGVDLNALLDELGRRGMTNLLVEGGAKLLGGMFDNKLVDEIHVFIAPKLIGGASAVGAVAGAGLAEVPQLPQLNQPQIELLDGDVYIHGSLHGC